MSLRGAIVATKQPQPMQVKIMNRRLLHFSRGLDTCTWRKYRCDHGHAYGDVLTRLGTSILIAFEF